jgi:hypothetical protein
VHVGDLSSHPLLVVLVMVLGGALAMTGVLALISWLWGRPTDVDAEPVPEVPVRPSAALREEWQRLTAHASAAAARAAQARAEAAAAQERSAAAEAVREVAWHEYETSETPVLTGAVVENASPAGGALAHAAFVAFRRGAISVRELQRVWGGRAEPDPEREERRREAARRAASEREARRAYYRAAAAARLAEEQARVAEVAAQALATEATDAEREAREAQDVAHGLGRRSLD